MKFQVVSLFPAIIEILRQDGVIGQALKAGLIELEVINPRDFTTDNHKTVDDRPFGGGDGMLMMAEPLEKAFTSIAQPGHVIFLSPKGKLLDDHKVQELAKFKNLTLICGRYAGVDQRFLNQVVDEEISIGDYVLSGGEMAACVLMDAVSRFQPGVLGHEDSALQDSITMGWLEAPAYTRPREWKGEEVPEILLSGHHEKIQEWKMFVGGLITFSKRPELLQLPPLSKMQKERWKQFAESLTTKQMQQWGIDTEKFALGNFVAFLEAL
jgi:tRNA (guanine37-N1)-methyltransferase